MLITELRADGLHINGYVNVPGRESRPFKHPILGRIVEVIEQRAFKKALERTSSVRMLLDHDRSRVIASTDNDSLKVYEDEVGLRAESIVTDEEVISAANEGRLRGWSFNMYNIKDAIEHRAEGLPLRHIREFDMNEITLAMNKIPVYRSTSIEFRAEDEEIAELRAGIDSDIEEEEDDDCEDCRKCEHRSKCSKENRACMKEKRECNGEKKACGKEDRAEEENNDPQEESATADFSVYNATIDLLKTKSL